MDITTYVHFLEAFAAFWKFPMTVYNGIIWLWESYNSIWLLVDHRVDGWRFMSSSVPTILFVCIYFLMVSYGPKFMKSRKPFSLYWTLITYNGSIAILNLHIFKELLVATNRRNYNWFCQTIPDTTDADESRIVSALYLYYISKLIEFLDTLFFIVRKKNEQLTFLHVYHHSTMFAIWWIIVRWVPGGSAVFGPLINSFVHVLMYTYYGLSVFGPRVVKYLWWKRYLTILQLIQFTVGLYFGINALIMNCPFTKWLQYLLVFYMLSYILLFGHFYRTVYINKNNKPSRPADVTNVNSKQMTKEIRFRRVISTSVYG